MRPCRRCIKIGQAEFCVDSAAKPRVKGFKRGPYKKRNSIAKEERAELSLITPGTTPETSPAPPSPHGIDVLSSLCEILVKEDSDGSDDSIVDVAKVLWDGAHPPTPPLA